MDDKEPDLKELQEELSSIRVLTEGRGWDWLVEQASARVQARFDLLMNLDRNLKQEDLPGIILAIGEMKAYNALINLPVIQREVLKEEIENRIAALEEENDATD